MKKKPACTIWRLSQRMTVTGRIKRKRVKNAQGTTQKNQRIYRQAQAQALTKSLPLVARTALSNGLTSVCRVCLLMA